MHCLITKDFGVDSQFEKLVDDELFKMEVLFQHSDRYYLKRIDKRLTFFDELQKLSISFDFETIYVELLTQRRRGSLGPLSKAVGLKDKEKKTIIDATCGTGRDSLHFLCDGHRVIAYEREPVIYLLLWDAYNRFSKKVNFEIYFGNPVSLLTTSDIVYLDPMYRPAKRKGLPNKEMQIFEELLPDDDKAAELFLWAKSAAKEKVIVKRSINADVLAPSPSHTLSGKTTRYDVYRTDVRSC